MRQHKRNVLIMRNLLGFLDLFEHVSLKLLNRVLRLRSKHNGIKRLHNRRLTRGPLQRVGAMLAALVAIEELAFL